MKSSNMGTYPNCPVTFALEVFGDRWTLLVLRDILLESRVTYKEIRAANPGIATNILAERLRRLLQRELITKKRDENDARRFVYCPTELAVSVIPILVEMIAWGSRHGNSNADPEFIRRFETDRQALLNELQEKVAAKL